MNLRQAPLRVSRVAGFIRVQSRQSSVPSLGRLGPFLKLAGVQKADVRGLDHAQKAQQHLLHAGEDLGQLFQTLADFKCRGIERFDLHAQNPLALVVDLEHQVSPADLGRP